MPSILANSLAQGEPDVAIENANAFPVTVFPDDKEIVEDPAVEELLSARPTALSASAGLAGGIFEFLAVRISEFSVYQQVAGTAGIETLFVTVYPGYRAEEVAATFGAKLGWNASERASFLKEARALNPELTDGLFVPGTYFVGVTDPAEVAGITQERFEQEILSRYASSTAAQVPLEDALTIASMIEREAGGWHDMRLISGIIWNRLFAGMNLQLDATMQYVKATNAKGAGGWWPTPKPDDKYLRSPYNTYRQAGLPPGPISNPSIASVLAALNPKKTDCLFYFHDKYGRFHCSPTYEGHVALLRKHYGQGR
jgi:cell division protein YceG involved in septum cleavage